MTKTTLLETLAAMGRHPDVVLGRIAAAEALLQYVDDPEISDAFHAAVNRPVPTTPMDDEPEESGVL